MGLEQATVKEIVDKAVTHKWGVPEFKRGFVWSPQKVDAGGAEFDDNDVRILTEKVKPLRFDNAEFE
jgi:hypothetical protein